MNHTTPTPITNPPSAQEILATELATYQHSLARLLTEDTFSDAVQMGYDRFGQTPFLVQQVWSEQRPAQIPWQRPSCPS